MIRVSSVGGGRPRRWGARSRVTLALLLAGALLICHGLFGASHVVAHGEAPPQGVAPVADEHPREMERPMAAPSGAHHAAGHAAGKTGTDGTPTGTPIGTAEYFAVLLALAGAALLATVVCVGRSAFLDPAWAVVSGRRVSGARFFSRGPSPPLLQVFRL